MKIAKFDGVKAIRLIPSRFPPVEIYARLGLQDMETIKQVETLTNPREKERRLEIARRAGRGLGEAAFQNWNHAPFAYPNSEGTRFFDSWSPALELAGELQTALAVSVRKREHFLSSSRQEPISLDMRMLSQKVTGKFMDCRDVDPDCPQDERRNLGEEVRAAGLAGVVYTPPERSGGTGYAVIDRRAIDRAVQAQHFRFVWDGSRISQIYAFEGGYKIDPEELAGPDAEWAA